MVSVFGIYTEDYYYTHIKKNSISLEIIVKEVSRKKNKFKFNPYWCIIDHIDLICKMHGEHNSHYFFFCNVS